jgi:predicted metallopeptidase
VFRRTNNKRVEWVSASDIKKRVDFLVKNLGLSWIDSKRVFCFRSQNSKARAYARIWGLSKIWQITLETPPTYIIEVISEKFDSLKKSQQDEVLLHEIAHIPKNFSGSLIPHYHRGKIKFKDLINNLKSLYNDRPEV